MLDRIYQALAPAAAHVVLRREPDWLRVRREARIPDGVLWCHGASAGEAAAGRRLLSTLGGGWLTSSTRAGCARAGARPAPLPGYPTLAGHPRGLILIESELWPDWLRAARRTRMPVAWLGARMSARSARWWGRAASWFRALMAPVETIGAADEATLARLERLGVRSVLTGPLKALQPVRPELTLPLRAGRWILASSYEEEEEALFPWFLRLAPPQLIIAPRRLERVDRIIERWQGSGRSIARASSGREADILVLDRMGWLAGCFESGQPVLLGGGWARGLHNPLEPLRAGARIAVGPRLGDWSSLVEMGTGVGVVAPVAQIERFLQTDHAPEASQALAERFDGLAANLELLRAAPAWVGRL